MRIAASPWVLPIALVLLAGGACVPRSAVDSLHQRVERLENDNFALRKDLAEARMRLEIQRESGRASGGGPATASTADAVARIPGDRPPDPQAPDASGAVSPIVYSEPITETSINTGGASTLPEEGRPGAGASAGSPPVVKAPAVRGGDPKSLMQAALGDLDARDAESALSGFQAVVSGFPGDALADDAQFGVGECYFQMGRYEDAIGAYRKVIEAFPFGDRVPYAFLKIGFARLALEQRDLALDSFRTVSEAYPGTEAATVARQQISHLSPR